MYLYYLYNYIYRFVIYYNLSLERSIQAIDMTHDKLPPRPQPGITRSMLINRKRGMLKGLSWVINR